MILAQTLAFISIRFLDVVDILFVAVLLYQLYNFIKGTVAMQIVLGVLSLYVIWAIVHAFEMDLLNGILEQIINVGVLALVIVFQKEIRQFLFILGRNNFIRKGSKAIMRIGKQLEEESDLNIEPIIIACENMSKTLTGALIVIASENDLRSYIETGIKIDAKISEHLIENIFYKNSPLHDGAIVIAENRVKAARCILPVSESKSISSKLGLRHRAAIGITEQTDAYAIIVSEQTGSISYCKNGNIKRDIKTSELKRIIIERFRKG